MLQPEELQSIANLQLMAKQTVEGAITGMHRSPHKGLVWNSPSIVNMCRAMRFAG